MDSENKFTFHEGDSTYNYQTQIIHFCEESTLWTKVKIQQNVDLSPNQNISKIKRYIDGSESITSKHMLVKNTFNLESTIPSIIIYHIPVDYRFKKEKRVYKMAFVPGDSAPVKHIESLFGLKFIINNFIQKGVKVFFVKVSQPKIGGGSAVKVIKADDILNSVSNLPNKDTTDWIIQPSLCPVLHAGRKWDCRHYCVMLHNEHHIVGLAYKDAFARISTEIFDLNSSSEFVQLTNSSIHRKRDHYSTEAFKMKVSQDISENELFKIVFNTLNSVKNSWKKSADLGYLILGFDTIFVSSSGPFEASPDDTAKLRHPSIKPYLIEVNDHPAMYIDDKNSGSLVCSIWRTLINHLFPSMLTNSLYLKELHEGREEVKGFRKVFSKKFSETDSTESKEDYRKEKRRFYSVKKSIKEFMDL